MPPFNQPNLLGDAQPDLFGDAAGVPKQYVPDPRHVRNRLQDMLGRMQAASTWPWPDHRVEFYRDRVWPYLFERLPDGAEAEEWRRRIECEAARLDAAAAR